MPEKKRGKSQEETKQNVKLEIGTILEGEVTGITKSGAFVALPGGRSGLVHTSEIAYSYVNDANELLTVGEWIMVKVIGMEEDNSINLSIKQVWPLPPRQQCPASRDGNQGTTAAAWGADESTNYLAYPTLMPVPQRVDPLQERVEELEAEVKRLRAAEKRRTAEAQRLQTSERTLLAENQRLRATEQRQEEERKRLQGEVQRLQTMVQRLQAENQRPRADARKAAELPVRKPKKPSRMGSRRINETYALDGVTPKENIVEVRFLDTLAGAPGTAADLSEAKDRSVLCWTKQGVLYIAGKGGVAAGKSCEKLFAGYKKVTAIHFDGNFVTSDVVNMYCMFEHCEALKTLDIADWDTSHVTRMDWMFSNCKSLQSLDVSRWDTSRVTKMGAMFHGCGSLTGLHLAGWNTSHVTDFGWMFPGGTRPAPQI